MNRQQAQGCPSGKPFAKKADAVAYYGHNRVRRCNRCKCWHEVTKHGKGRGR